MQDEWDERTVVSTEIAAPDPSGNTRARLIVLAGSDVGEMYEIGTEHVLGRSLDADVRLHGEGVSRKHARVRLIDDAVVYEDLGSTNGSFVNGARVKQRTLCEGDRIQLGSGLILKFTYHDALEESFQRQMYESASRDMLTRAYNKRFFMEQLDSEFAFATRHGSALSLVMFDVDHFDQFNERFGRDAGDFVLSELARQVVPTIRLEDIFARVGGEEFVVLSRCEPLAAAVVGERLRKCVEQHSFAHDGPLPTLPTMPPPAAMPTAPMAWHLTVSVGIEGMPNPRIKTPIELIDAAEHTLAEAKRAGRNRVLCAGHTL